MEGVSVRELKGVFADDWFYLEVRPESLATRTSSLTGDHCLLITLDFQSQGSFSRLLIPCNERQEQRYYGCTKPKGERTVELIYGRVIDNARRLLDENAADPVLRCRSKIREKANDTLYGTCRTRGHDVDRDEPGKKHNQSANSKAERT